MMGAAVSKSEDIPKGVRGFDERSLCPDGSCIGVIEENGRCSICGKNVQKGRIRAKDSSEKKGEEEESYRGGSINEDVKADAGDIDAEDPKTELHDSGESGFDPDRKVCSDGSCTGIIGKNGTCKECGKPYSG